MSRARSILRPRNVILALVALVALLVLALGIAAWPVYTARPNPTTDYGAELRTLALGATATTDARADEAWNALMAASDLLLDVRAEQDERAMRDGFEPRTSWDQGELDFPRVTGGRIVPPDTDREQQAIATLRERGIFDLLDEMARLGPALPPPVGASMMLGGDMPPLLSESRGLAKMLGASMRLSAAAGNPEAVARDYERLLALGRSISLHPTIMNHLVGQAIDALAHGELQRCLMEADFDEAACRAMMETLDRQAIAPVSLGLEGERALFQDWVQHCYSDDGAGDGYLLAPLVPTGLPQGGGNGQLSLLGAVASRFAYASRAEIVTAYDDVVDRLIERSTRPRNGRWDEFDPAAVAESMPRRLMLLGLLLPALGKSVDTSDYNARYEGSVRLMLALEIHIARHAPPPDLDALVPDLLPELPVDPISGEPFHYEVLDGDEAGRPYLLASRDPDRESDAVAPNDPDLVQLTGKPGVYRVMNPPRPELYDE